MVLGSMLARMRIGVCWERSKGSSKDVVGREDVMVDLASRCRRPVG